LIPDAAFADIDSRIRISFIRVALTALSIPELFPSALVLSEASRRLTWVSITRARWRWAR